MGISLNSYNGGILDNRLAEAAEYVRNNSVFADIGTDHAYLPIYLISTGRIKRAAACDIAEGPCRRAEKNIISCGMQDKIEVIQTDGLDGIEKTGCSDICIAGMGGELIAHIIDNSGYVKNKDINLILQPMTRAEALRSYLDSAGFDIINESLVRENIHNGKIYQVINCRYDGVKRKSSPAELILGRLNIHNRPQLFGEFLDRNIEIYRNILNGMRQSENADRKIDEINGIYLEFMRLCGK